MLTVLTHNGRCRERHRTGRAVTRSLALSLAGLALLSTVAGPVSAQESLPVNAVPDVVPAVQRWTGGVGHLRVGPSTRIVIDPADGGALREVAGQLRADLAEITGLPVHAVLEGRARDGDLVVDLDPAADVGPTALALAEGYRLAVDGRATITSRTAVGAYWGTRTLLQMLSRDGRAESTLAVGSLAWVFGTPAG